MNLPMHLPLPCVMCILVFKPLGCLYDAAHDQKKNNAKYECADGEVYIQACKEISVIEARPEGPPASMPQIVLLDHPPERCAC